MTGPDEVKEQKKVDPDKSLIIGTSVINHIIEQLKDEKEDPQPFDNGWGEHTDYWLEDNSGG